MSAKKIDESAKWFSKYTLCQQKLAESTKCLVMTQQNMLNTQKFAVSAKIGWISKNMLCQQKNLTSQQNELIQQKICFVSKHLLSQQKCLVTIQQKMLSKQKFAVSAKLAELAKICCINKNSMSQQNELIQQKYAFWAKTCWVGKHAWWRLSMVIMTQHICCVSNNVSLSRSTTYFDPTLTDCLSCVDFDRHLVSVSRAVSAKTCCISK